MWDWQQMKTRVTKARNKEGKKESNNEWISHSANHHMPSILADYGIYLVKYSQVKAPCV